MPLRIVFMGTPEFSVPTLAALLEAGHEIAAVYTQPPRPAGRGMDQRKSPVHVRAEALGIPVFTPLTLRTTEATAEFRAHAAAVAVVVAYGLILPQPILDAPAHGCLNLHASALPRWRGAAPIQRAIMAGDRSTAVMVMRMEAGLDTGPICLSEAIPIGLETTAGELHDVLAERGAALMVRAIAALEAGGLATTPQPTAGVTYARKIEKSEAHIDFNQPACGVRALIRGLSPIPGAWIEVGPENRGERIKVLRASVVSSGPVSSEPGTIVDDRLTVACSPGTVRLLELQRAGRKPMSAEELTRGFALPPGTRLR